MAELLVFRSRANATAQENLNDFVSHARDGLTAFADGGAWNELTWRNEWVSVVFCKHRPMSEARRPPVPLDEVYLPFAKAYFRDRYSHKPAKAVTAMISAIRMVELALIDATGHASILNLSVPVLDQSARNCVDRFKSKDTMYQVGCHIAALANFCRDNGLAPALPSWKSPFRKPPILTETLTEEGARHRESKLPDTHSMLALADLFAQANDFENQYYTSIAALMMFAPNRVSEVLALPVDCIGWEENFDGEKQMFLRWRAAKGGGPTKKWVPETMQTVVKEAVSRLTRIGAPAREAAKFAHDNPGRFMRHALCSTSADFGEDDDLGPQQIAGALAMKIQHVWGLFGSTLNKLHNDGPISYRTLAELAAKRYQGRSWPYTNASRSVLTWEALCLAREFECHKEFSARPFSWKLIDSTAINDRLGRRQNLSLFERSGLQNPDGSCIYVTTHQLRHWLSTMSVRAGMDNYTLARWAGRARIEDNRHYDHRTQEERSHELRLLLGKGRLGTLERFKTRQPVTYQELGVDRLGTALATLYGLCLHDYTMSPCLKATECMTCTEHRCIKGDHVTLDRIKRLEEMGVYLLDKARQDAAGGDFGTDRWVDHHVWKLTNVRTIRRLLEAQSVPDGAVIGIPAEYDPSPIRRSLMDRDLVNAPNSSDSLQATVLAIDGPDDA